MYEVWFAICGWQHSNVAKYESLLSAQTAWDMLSKGGFNMINVRPA